MEVVSVAPRRTQGALSEIQPCWLVGFAQIGVDEVTQRAVVFGGATQRIIAIAFLTGVYAPGADPT